MYQCVSVVVYECMSVLSVLFGGVSFFDPIIERLTDHFVHTYFVTV